MLLNNAISDLHPSVDEKLLTNEVRKAVPVNFKYDDELGKVYEKKISTLKYKSQH